MLLIRELLINDTACISAPQDVCEARDEYPVRGGALGAVSRGVDARRDHATLHGFLIPGYYRMAHLVAYNLLFTSSWELR